MALRIDELREQAEHINDTQEKAEESLELIEARRTSCMDALSAAQARVQAAATPEDRRRAMMQEASARAVLAEVERALDGVKDELRDIETERAMVQQQTRHYLEQTQSAYERLGSAMQSGPYGGRAIRAANGSLLDSIFQGQQVMELLGGTSPLMSFGSFPGVTAGGGISLHTLRGAMVYEKGSQDEDSSPVANPSAGTLPIVDEFRRQLWEAMEPSSTKVRKIGKEITAHWPDKEELRNQVLLPYLDSLRNTDGYPIAKELIVSAFEEDYAVYSQRGDVYTTQNSRTENDGDISGLIANSEFDTDRSDVNDDNERNSDIGLENRFDGSSFGHENDTPPSTDSVTDGGMNANAHDDIKKVWDYISSAYGRDSVEYQECAWRYLEHLEEQRGELEKQFREASELVRQITRECSSYLKSSAVDGEFEKDSKDFYQELSARRQQAVEAARALGTSLDVLECKIRDLHYVADSERRTTFISLANKSFTHAYDGLITERQGLALAEFESHCGINEVCSMTNQQRGYSICPTEGIKTAFGHKDADGKHDPLLSYIHDSENPRHYAQSNGLTTWNQRKRLLDFYGLETKRIERHFFHKSKDISPNDILGYLQSGYSVGLTIKGQDLSQKGLSQRIEWIKDERGYLQCPTSANHCVNVVGVSVNAKGRPTCIWLNDTGNFSESNRVPISVKKYMQMLRHTKRFGVELGRWSI